ITTLITAAVLYQFGSGPVRGFAVTLTIGILASMFTAILVSRAIFDTFVSNKNRDTLSI
ncbi:MAG: protein translocase subunit SecD, partial [Candidatus Cloacimonetes bacterium]|nr:protein translocase subunit SecD [Candidatus Cloacimonadota bacterium]